MAKKKIKTTKETEEKEEILVPEAAEKNENTTLIWFLVIVGVVFASVLVPYFWVESTKAFEFGGVDWTIEDYESLRIFHGRFVSLTNQNLNYNIFLRMDPRKNDAEVSGRIDDFKYGGVISLEPEVESCRGELSRVMLDLGAFLKQGVGVGPIESGSTSEEIANASGRKFTTCENTNDRTVVVVGIGKDRGIVKSDVNPNCYVITAETCEDSAVVEKFMVRAVEDFGEKLENLSA